MKTELSPREREFMAHIVNGLTTTKAAVQMGIGKETAKSYSTTTRMKMGAHTLAQAAVIFYRQQTTGPSMKTIPRDDEHVLGPTLRDETPMVTLAQADAMVAADRERIKDAVLRCMVLAEDCECDAPEVDTARKALACTILAAIAGYEAPPPVGTTGSLFGPNVGIDPHLPA